jgi:putative membrane protein
LIPYTALPTVNAALNGLSAVLLSCGYLSIRRRRVARHRAFMLSALACSALFLVSYLVYHAHAGVHRYPGVGARRTVYLSILGTHTVLAVVIVPLILRAVYLALNARYPEHRAIARWTLPLWLYVSVTGVIVYWMLYR